MPTGKKDHLQCIILYLVLQESSNNRGHIKKITVIREKQRGRSTKNMFLLSEILNLGVTFLNTLRLRKESFTGRYSVSKRRE